MVLSEGGGSLSSRLLFVSCVCVCDLFLFHSNQGKVLAWTLTHGVRVDMNP